MIQAIKKNETKLLNKNKREKDMIYKIGNETKMEREN